MNIFRKVRNPLKAGVAVSAVALLLAGCEELINAEPGATPNVSAQEGAATIENDVERPDIFSVSENALWDGRPSLGGVWVAYPNNIDPERVIIRNIENGKSVIGALFRRERENPGPRIQLSSDAASALGVIAGSPTELSITVLRREVAEIDVPLPPEVEAPAQTIEAPARRAPTPPPVVVPEPAPVVEAAVGIAAIVEQTLADVPVIPQDTASEPQVSRLRKPNIQVATFAQEQRAKDLVTVLENEGIQASIREDATGEPTLYRVISGPISTRSERAERLRIIKGLGFTDAFFFR